MTEMNFETKTLLDKLYNLRGEKSVILASMDEEREKAILTRDKTSEQKKELENIISSLNSEENLLTEEGAKLQSALEIVGKEDFITVLNLLNISFNPGDLINQVSVALPLTLEKVAQKKVDNQNQLVQVEDEMNDAIMRIEELGIRKDEALSDQARLNRFFDMALNGSINVTRDEITSLLAKLDFNEDEQRQGAKILMFPEDGLLEYEKYSGNVELKEEKETEPTSEEETVIEFDNISEPEISMGPSITFEPIIEPQVEEVVTDTKEVEPEEISQKETFVSLEEVVNFMTNLGFDYLDFTSNDFNKMIDNFDAEIFTKNVKLIEKYDINKDVFADNIEMLYDPELESKFNLLMEIGKEPRDIYLNPRIITKYNLDELNNAIKTLSDSGLEPKSVPLMAY